MPRPAIGAGALYGIKMEAPSDVYSVGLPIPAGAADAVTAPAAAPTSAASVGAGNITALQVQWRFAYIKAGGFYSAPSDWSVALDLTAKNGELSDLTNSADSDVIGKAIERRIGTARCVVKRIWNNTTTTFTDSFSTTSTDLDFNDRLPEYTETGVNGEFKFPYVESADAMAQPKTIVSPVITAAAGEPKGLAGAVGLDHTIKGVANPGELVHYLLSMGLTCVKYGVKATAWVTDLSDVDEPTRKYVFTPKGMGELGTKSFSIHNHGGGTNVNAFFWQNKASEITLKTSNDKHVEAETKILGIGYTPHGLPAPTLDAGAPDLVTLPVLFGRRADASADTESTYVKVTVAPAAGSFSIKAKDASAASYAGTAQAVLYDAVSKKQKQQTGMFSDKLVLNDQTDTPMGFGNGRPLMFAVGGDCETLEANDEFVFPPVPRIPGAGSTPGTDDGTYTGFAPKRITSPDFTDAHCFAEVADVGLLIAASQIKIIDPKRVIDGHGTEAGYGYDVQDTGKKTIEVQLTRYFEDLSYQKRMEILSRSTLMWKLEGELIPVTPGTFSAQRETVQVDVTLAEVQDAKPTIGGADVRMETVTLRAKDPGTEDAPYTITVITREDVVIPA